MRAAIPIIALFAAIGGQALTGPAIAQRQTPRFGPDRGALLLGGGFVPELPPPEVSRRFIELAGGRDANVVIIPTADPALDSTSDRFDPKRDSKDSLTYASKLGLRNVSVLHAQDGKTADSESFVSVLRKAGGVWIPGGRPELVIAAYRGTLVERELVNLLRRGGVIAGDSAGSLCLTSRWLAKESNATVDSLPKMLGPGFGFVENVFLSVHVDAMNNQLGLVKVQSLYPESIGIGIDENTAVVLRGGRIEVLGRGKVTITDGIRYEGKPVLILSGGGRYDLSTRTIVR